MGLSTPNPKNEEDIHKVTERGKIAKIELEDQPDCTETFMVIDQADDGGILVAIQTYF